MDPVLFCFLCLPDSSFFGVVFAFAFQFFGQGVCFLFVGCFGLPSIVFVLMGALFLHFFLGGLLFLFAYCFLFDFGVASCFHWEACFVLLFLFC